MKFIQYGFGPIGQRVASYAIDNGMTLEAVLDSDPEKIGNQASEFIDNETNVTIEEATDDIMKKYESKIVFLTTVSSALSVFPQIKQCAEAKKNVVSTCEELSYPWKRNHDAAYFINYTAKENGVSVLSTGVNPGFAMDALPIFLTSICKDVESIKIERYQDSSIRRLPFQRKIGTGCTKEMFNNLVKEEKIKHVGFPESTDMIADALGWKLDHIEETIKPVIARKKAESEHFTIKKGNALGVKQVCKGFVDYKEVITLELQAYLGHKSPRDSVKIKGEPSIISTVKGGINGDIATCAMTVNAGKKIVKAKPGLLTMLDMELVSFKKI